jgi:hypothetical protein
MVGGTQDKIIKQLKWIAENYPQIVWHGPLEKGDTIQKGWGTHYLIDDPNIWLEIVPSWNEDSNNLKVAWIYSAIYNHGFENRGEGFTNKKLQQAVLASGSEVPFSEVIQLNMSECTEKAILLHLALQDRFECFLVNGMVYEPNGGMPIGAHHFNIIIRPGVGPYLVDVHNPIRHVNGGVSPRDAFMIPIIDMIPDSPGEPLNCFVLKPKRGQELNHEYCIT